MKTFHRLCQAAHREARKYNLTAAETMYYLDMLLRYHTEEQVFPSDMTCEDLPF